MLIKILLLIVVSITGFIAGKELTEGKRFNIANKYPTLDFKPINCRPCSTFHICIIFQLIAAYIQNDKEYAVFGILLSLIIFLYLYITDLKHIR
ncbi:hypothetical protein EZS27_014623 [termite gut metagenome]|uniref:Uncharacterized protein n=1 Tax=termite gut metagenome TaxID=433724 RepID=A0A5J4RVN2_9ZZZZ